MVRGFYKRQRWKGNMSWNTLDWGFGVTGNMEKIWRRTIREESLEKDVRNDLSRRKTNQTKDLWEDKEASSAVTCRVGGAVLIWIGWKRYETKRKWCFPRWWWMLSTHAAPMRNLSTSRMLLSLGVQTREGLPCSCTHLYSTQIPCISASPQLGEASCCYYKLWLLFQSQYLSLAQYGAADILFLSSELLAKKKKRGTFVFTLSTFQGEIVTTSEDVFKKNKKTLLIIFTLF